MELPDWLDAFLRVAVMLGFIMTSVLALTWMERKVLARIQQRMGPMRTGPHGIFQAPADAIKLLSKEDIAPATADLWVFRTAPYLVFVPMAMMFVVVPFSSLIVVRHLDMGLFYLVALSSVSIVGMLMAGWGSDNKYALVGGIRAAAQLVSYELPLGFALLGVALIGGSLNLQVLVEQQTLVPYLLLQPLGFLIFLIASLAEMSRTPFDIPIAESEVVGGPLIEYSGLRWGVFFLAEYASIWATAAVTAAVYFGGWTWPFLPSVESGFLAQLPGLAWYMIKVIALVYFVYWLRGTLPRLRMDQLMSFAWKILIPFSFVNLLIAAASVVFGVWLLSLGWLATIAMAYVVYIQSKGPLSTVSTQRSALSLPIPAGTSRSS